ncbi:hypothetical protein BN132_717 [Cronobacter turicensis 564]|nr:hypothetical protein BN132_717 [Cronobacter turicensis 564]
MTAIENVLITVDKVFLVCKFLVEKNNLSKQNACFSVKFL